MRIGNAVGAAVANRRVLDPVEARLLVGAGVLLLAFAVFPSLLAYPLVAIAAWFGLALLLRGYKLRRTKQRGKTPSAEDPPRGVAGKAPLAELRRD
jgi:cardiolipin synthase